MFRILVLPSLGVSSPAKIVRTDLRTGGFPPIKLDQTTTHANHTILAILEQRQATQAQATFDPTTPGYPRPADQTSLNDRPRFMCKLQAAQK